VSEILFVLALAIACPVIALGGFYLGYERGVKHTEQRWSDAVGRAEDARRGGHA
jgi:hypothetical protein